MVNKVKVMQWAIERAMLGVSIRDRISEMGRRWCKHCRPNLDEAKYRTVENDTSKERHVINDE